MHLCSFLLLYLPPPPYITPLRSASLSLSFSLSLSRPLSVSLSPQCTVKPKAAFGLWVLVNVMTEGKPEIYFPSGGADVTGINPLAVPTCSVEPLQGGEYKTKGVHTHRPTHRGRLLEVFTQKWVTTGYQLDCQFDIFQKYICSRLPNCLVCFIKS